MNSRYIPENAKEIKKDGLDAVAYAYESENGAVYAIAYSGRRNKSDFQYRFESEQKRADSIANFFKRIEARAQYKHERVTAYLSDGRPRHCSWYY